MPLIATLLPEPLAIIGDVHGERDALHKLLDRAVFLSMGSKACAWHGDGAWEVDTLLPSATLVSRCTKDLAFLQLHHGNRRVTLEEAEAIGLLENTGPGGTD